MRIKKVQKIRKINKRIETIDFKTFCSGGSPEYIKAKKIVAESGMKRRSPIVYSFYFNPAAFFDPTFILIGAGIVLVAVIEKKFADNGLISIASFLSAVLRISLPIVALGSIIYLIEHSSFLL